MLCHCYHDPILSRAHTNVWKTKQDKDARQFIPKLKNRYTFHWSPKALYNAEASKCPSGVCHKQERETSRCRRFTGLHCKSTARARFTFSKLQMPVPCKDCIFQVFLRFYHYSAEISLVVWSRMKKLKSLANEISSVFEKFADGKVMTRLKRKTRDGTSTVSELNRIDIYSISDHCYGRVSEATGL